MFGFCIALKISVTVLRGAALDIYPEPLYYDGYDDI